DTWEWSGSAWSQKSATGPLARWDQTMATLGNKVVLFGGVTSGTALLDDTWEWDGVSWSQVGNAIAPSARLGHAMATLGGKVVLFGGSDSYTAPHALADTWEWDGATWTKRDIAGPQAGASH